ncbi:4-hydroxythreonine-4-phosphate dehydrogenase PdxA, partial [Escherichia coli]|uniref:4-hydroxythreonine-4-phosphate dehydrogenase PdxA n=1 Tax=Escherichia coli TaxID=562 RepID=UPI00321B02A9
PGVLSADAGRFAYLAVERGVRLAQSGRIQGIVTAPLNKEALNKAGYHYAGHTEMLAELTGSKGSVMMLAHDNMRVSHLTTHVALKDVPG